LETKNLKRENLGYENQSARAKIRMNSNLYHTQNSDRTVGTNNYNSIITNKVDGCWHTVMRAHKKTSREKWSDLIGQIFETNLPITQSSITLQHNAHLPTLLVMNRGESPNFGAALGEFMFVSSNKMLDHQSSASYLPTDRRPQRSRLKSWTSRSSRHASS
jgi:hypothetical protein